MDSVVSYRRNYLKIYLWQSVSILLGFASLFVVVPYLSSDKTLYGIYSVCISLTFFFTYADLGFVSAGVKYAAEYFIQGDRKNEMRVIGFTAFIMISAFVVIVLAILVLSIFPEFLIPEVVVGSGGYNIARSLLLTLAISCPVLIGQRILAIIFTIRVEDYLFQQMMIVGNIARIVSVLYFFHNGEYKVVEYYIFYQSVNFIIVIFGLLYIRRYGYNLFEFLRTIHFDKDVFDKVKRISGTSLVMTICMILYYELDQIAISHWIGIEAVAMYGAALSVLTLVRTFSSVVFSPYASRYNHYVGKGDMDGLTTFVNKMILMFGLVLVVPIATLSFFAKSFVMSWLGDDYIESALLISLMVWSFAPNFIKDPINSYFVATERNKILLKYNCLTPIIYWISIIVTKKFLGIYSFALFKFIAPILIAFFYWKIAYTYFKDEGYNFVLIKDVFLPLIPPLLTIGALYFIVSPCMFYSHDKISLFVNILIMGVCLIIAFVVGILTNKILRKELYNIMALITSKLKNN